MQQRLQDTKRITLDASGNGSVIFGPGRPNELWTVNRVSTGVSTQVREAQFKVFRGSIGPGSYISGSISGSTGDTDDGINEVLNAGEYLTAQWIGGDVGATATVTYWGNIDV